MTLQQWMDQWRHKSPAVQDRVRIALQFLQKHYGVEKADKVLSEIRCIHFSHQVELPTIPAKTTLVGS